MKTTSPDRHRLLRWITFLIVSVIVVLYVALPIGIGVSVVLPYQETVGAPPAGFEAVTLTTEDGVALAGWYQPPSNGAVIIVLHGAGGSREGMRSHIDLLTRHGYGVLALDLRGHGGSGGLIIGGALIVFGLIIMLQNMGLMYLQNWWALFILIPAFGSFAAA